MGKKNNKDTEKEDKCMCGCEDECNCTPEENCGCNCFENEKQDISVINLQKDLENSQNEAKKNLENLQRIMAEFDNYKKRVAKEKENMYNDLVADIINNFLEVIDNLDRAIGIEQEKFNSIDSLDKTKNIEQKENEFKNGIILVQRQFLDVLRKYNIEEINSLGKTFDPKLHESVQHIDDENYGDKEIVDVFRKGYKLGDKVIRYAMVKVAN